ncbi:MAG: signal peptidase II [Clostridia bacterium]|nr:signal peptidase II [Clostridia bacterium]
MNTIKRFFSEFSFPGGCKYRLWTLLPAALLIALDQWLKYLATVHLKGNPAIPLIEDVFELLYVENPGAAFSILQNQRLFFILFTGIVMLFLLTVLVSGRYRRYMLLNISFVLVLAGGIGNLIDRIVNGVVIDYLYFKWIDFPVFNFADCCLVIGAILMLIFFFFVYEDTSLSKQKQPPANKTEEASDEQEKLDNP